MEVEIGEKARSIFTRSPRLAKCPEILSVPLVSFLKAAQKAWAFIEKYFVDRKHGEWFWRVDKAGWPAPAEPKVSQWKGPYHGVRACLETIRKLTLMI